MTKYEDYLFKIKILAKALQVNVEWRTNPSDGSWLPSRRAIVIDPDLSETETLSTLLHELGHVIDDSVMREKNAAVVAKSYAVVYTKHYSTNDVSVVVAAEIRAWNYGAAIAKNLGIRTGKWYDKFAREELSYYKKLSKGAK